MQSTREQVLAQLEAYKGSFVSGGELAARLGLSRNAVWKAVRTLADDGHVIESVTGKGYRLSPTSCILSAASVQHYLTAENVKVEFHDSIDSTNNRCKELAEHGAPQGMLVVANCQTAGRGRQGRPFHSPAGSGVYFSLLLRPKFSLGDVTLVTSLSAVCLAQAVDEVCSTRTQIKWVNDLFCDGYKVSGILTEASFDAESGSVAHAVVGIGVNVFDAPDAAQAPARAAFHSLCGPQHDDADIRARIVAGCASRILDALPHLPERPHLAEYRERSLLDGRTVQVESRAHGNFEAEVLGINDDFTLRIRTADGHTLDLSHGEVHIPSSQLQER